MRRVSLPTILTAFVAGIAIWLSFGSLAVTDAASSRTIGLLAPFWLVALSTAATVVLFCGVARVRRVTHSVMWSLLILLPWRPIPVPDAFLIWTGPVVVLVWIAIGLCALPGLLRHINRGPARFLFDAPIAPNVAWVM